jgi:hypothetical protein
MSLTIKELTEKITKIDDDITKLRNEVGSERKISVLADYKEYLNDEIRLLKQKNRGSNG